MASVNNNNNNNHNSNNNNNNGNPPNGSSSNPLGGTALGLLQRNKYEDINYLSYGEYRWPLDATRSLFPISNSASPPFAFLPAWLGPPDPAAASSGFAGHGLCSGGGARGMAPVKISSNGNSGASSSSSTLPSKISTTTDTSDSFMYNNGKSIESTTDRICAG